MNHFSLVLVVIVASPRATHTREVDTIHRFYRIVSTTSPTIANFTELFGRESEAELDAILAVHHPAAVDPASNDRILKFTQERLANQDHASEFLRCIRRLRPQLFSPRGMPELKREERSSNDDSFTRIVARTRGGKVVFVFSKGVATIEDIEMPGGASVYTLIPECGLHSRPSGETGR